MFMTCIDTRTLRLLALALAAAGTLLTALPAWAQMPTGLHRLQHIVVIYLENRSFDNLYGLFPGATGIANAGAAALQVDHDGTPFAKLPPVIDTRLRPARPRHALSLPTAKRPVPARALRAAGRRPDGESRPSLLPAAEQINSGNMNKFAVVSNAGGLVMGHFDGSTMQLWDYAKRYTLADHFFHAAFGGSFSTTSAHLCLLAAALQRARGHPRQARRARQARQGRAGDARRIRRQHHAAEHGPKNPALHHDELLPPQDMPTIATASPRRGHVGLLRRRLERSQRRHGRALAFSYHHQPFAFSS